MLPFELSPPTEEWAEPTEVLLCSENESTLLRPPATSERLWIDELKPTRPLLASVAFSEMPAETGASPNARPLSCRLFKRPVGIMAAASGAALASAAPRRARVISDTSRGAGDARSESAGDGGTCRPPATLLLVWQILADRPTDCGKRSRRGLRDEEICLRGVNAGGGMDGGAGVPGFFGELSTTSYSSASSSRFLKYLRSRGAATNTGVGGMSDLFE
mmetsp:Transcript_5429/g.16611  ORF Transcript_5429/g.16611 Transcript_5429/m.16611 type:complete len:218 (+) Transcript_5429:1120-1773(+)